MSSTDMSMDTIMEDDESFASVPNATIYGVSGRTESLISDLNILNSSSMSEDDYHQQQMRSVAGDSSDDLIVSSCASSNLFSKNSKPGEVRLFNVVIGASSSDTQSQNQFAQAENSSFRMWISDSYSNLPVRNQRQSILKKSIALLRKLWDVMKPEQIRSTIVWPRMPQESPPVVGFRKIDPERWEFANEALLKGNKHLLRNIKTPNSLPPTEQGLDPCVELGRFGLDGEVDRLRRDKRVLMAEIVKLRHNQQNVRRDIQVLMMEIVKLRHNQQNVGKLKEIIQDLPSELLDMYMNS